MSKTLEADEDIHINDTEKIKTPDGPQTVYLYYRPYQQKWVFSRTFDGSEVLAYKNGPGDSPQNLNGSWNFITNTNALLPFQIQCYGKNMCST